MAIHVAMDVRMDVVKDDVEDVLRVAMDVDVRAMVMGCCVHGDDVLGRVDPPSTYGLWVYVYVRVHVMGMGC